MKKRMDNHHFWQVMDGYKLGVAAVLGLVALFFLLVTIMPIVVFKTLEDASWELKTFAMSYRPAAALIGLVLFVATGWGLLRVVRAPEMPTRVRSRANKAAVAGAKPETGQQTGLSLGQRVHSLRLPWQQRGAQKPMGSAAETPAVAAPVVETKHAAPEAGSGEAWPGAQAGAERA